MSDYDYHLKIVERIASRFTKADLVKHCAAMIADYDKRAEEANARASKYHEEVERLKNEVRNLGTMRSAVATVLAVRGGLAMDNPQQLSLLLGTEHVDMADDGEDSKAENVLSKLLDNCNEMIEAFGGNGAPTYDELVDALDVAIADRNELLKKFGLTEFQWSVQGGASFVDLEV